MSFDQVKQLPDLLGFHLALHFLKIQELRDIRMGEDVVASLYALDTKSKRFRQPQKIAKPHIVRSHEDSLEKPLRSHPTKYPPGGVCGYVEITAALGRKSS